MRDLQLSYYTTLVRRVNLRIAREEDDCCEVALLVILELEHKSRNIHLVGV